MKKTTVLFIEFALLELNAFLKEARKNGADCAMTELKLEEAKNAFRFAPNKEKRKIEIIITELEQMHRACCLPREIAENDDSDCGV